MASDLAIETHRLSRRFGDNLAVDDLDLRVRKGEIYGFLGPNGAGKTTVVRMLVTLLAPTMGEAKVMGHDVVHEAAAVRLGIGVALQEASLDDQQTGVELLRLQARLYGLASEEFEQRIDHLRRLIDIGEALEHRIGTYSGGMRRRLSLAAALVHNPEMLFLDEPTTGLDPVNRRAMWNEIVRLNEEVGISILLTTQYLDEADALADRVGIIDEGRLVAEGTPGELKSEIGNDVVVVRTEGDLEGMRTALERLPGIEGVEIHDHELLATAADGAGTVGAIARVFDERDFPLHQLVVRTPTLDDVFLDATGNRLTERGNGDDGD